MKSTDISKKNLRYWPDTQQLMKPAKEVSEIMGVHYNTLFKMVKSGQIECVRYGNKILFTFDQVEQFIKNNRYQTKKNYGV